MAPSRVVAAFEDAENFRFMVDNSLGPEYFLIPSIVDKTYNLTNLRFIEYCQGMHPAPSATPPPTFGIRFASRRLYPLQ